MKSTDKRQRDICAMDLAGPVPPKPTKQERADARAAKYRAKNGVKALTVNINVDVLAAFDALCIAKDRKKSAVIEKLIQTQLLRKR